MQSKNYKSNDLSLFKLSELWTELKRQSWLNDIYIYARPGAVERGEPIMYELYPAKPNPSCFSMDD
jgi:hypothetical protein